MAETPTWADRGASIRRWSVWLRPVTAVLSAVGRLSSDFVQDAKGDLDEVVARGIRGVGEKTGGLLGVTAARPSARLGLG